MKLIGLALIIKSREESTKLKRVEHDLRLKPNHLNGKGKQENRVFINHNLEI